ncbi:hypothetical protein GCM10010517_80280 [Streptosporangium fragile]|uniref:Uncharacterized protein n=1 Tax=Streptosporangium fragile TaxID=46186 RepID=A0ABN3WFM0_9ACTN
MPRLNAETTRRYGVWGSPGRATALLMRFRQWYPIGTAAKGNRRAAPRTPEIRELSRAAKPPPGVGGLRNIGPKSGAEPCCGDAHHPPDAVGRTETSHVGMPRGYDREPVARPEHRGRGQNSP